MPPTLNVAPTRRTPSPAPCPGCGQLPQQVATHIWHCFDCCIEVSQVTVDRLPRVFIHRVNDDGNLTLLRHYPQHRQQEGA